MRRHWFPYLLWIIVILSIPVPARADLGDLSPVERELVMLINGARVEAGLTPYRVDPILTAAARAHVDDILSTGQLGHRGSDGSRAEDRARAAGYPTYPVGGQIGEVWVYARSLRAGFDWWMSDPPHRANILHRRYRDIGVAVRDHPSGWGVVAVVMFGAQPNVLSVFIDTGAEVTGTRQLTIWLQNEEMVPQGAGVDVIGRAVEVQISTSPDFADAWWQPWEQTIVWEVPGTTGEHTVFVRFRDAAGRMAVASDTITYVPQESPSDEAAQTSMPGAARSATYVVQAGDTLIGIGRRLGIRWEDLARLNGIDDPRRLQVGQVLTLP